MHVFVDKSLILRGILSQHDVLDISSRLILFSLLRLGTFPIDLCMFLNRLCILTELTCGEGLLAIVGMRRACDDQARLRVATE